MADILILTLVFPPDNVSTAQLMADLTEDLQKHGHRVTVLTTVPHYNPDPGAEGKQPLIKSWGWLLKQSMFRGATVYHTWMPRKGRRKIYRILTWIGFHIISTVVGCFKVARTDVIVCPSPPLTIGISAWVIASFHRAKFVYNVQEIYPDVAINLGIVKNRMLIRILYQIEQFVYKKAAAITVISPRMQKHLQKKGVQIEKLKLIPNFADIDYFKPVPKENEFSCKNQFLRKFVISYAGNMGKPQHLEILIEAAALLQHRKDIQFLMIGSGSECDELKRYVKKLQIENIKFIPQQPYSEMPLIYASTDFSYVPQALGTSSDGVPSKVYRSLASGCPVLACTDKDSDLAVLIEEAQGGYVVTKADPGVIAKVIEQAVANRSVCAEMGARGREHVVKYYGRHAVGAAYSDLLTKLAENRRT